MGRYFDWPTPRRRLGFRTRLAMGIQVGVIAATLTALVFFAAPPAFLAIYVAGFFAASAVVWSDSYGAAGFAGLPVVMAWPLWLPTYATMKTL